MVATVQVNLNRDPGTGNDRIFRSGSNSTNFTIARSDATCDLRYIGDIHPNEKVQMIQDPPPSRRKRDGGRGVTTGETPCLKLRFTHPSQKQNLGIKGLWANIQGQVLHPVPRLRFRYRGAVTTMRIRSKNALISIRRLNTATGRFSDVVYTGSYSTPTGGFPSSNDGFLTIFGDDEFEIIIRKNLDAPEYGGFSGNSQPPNYEWDLRIYFENSTASNSGFDGDPDEVVVGVFTPTSNPPGTTPDDDPDAFVETDPNIYNNSPGAIAVRGGVLKNTLGLFGGTFCDPGGSSQGLRCVDVFFEDGDYLTGYIRFDEPFNASQYPVCHSSNNVLTTLILFTKYGKQIDARYHPPFNSNLQNRNALIGFPFPHNDQIGTLIVQNTYSTVVFTDDNFPPT